MSEKEEITITFEVEKLTKLKNAKSLFERDIKKPLEMDEFIDMLVEAYLKYRDARGASESSLLQKMAKNKTTV